MSRSENAGVQERAHQRLNNFRIITDDIVTVLKPPESLQEGISTFVVVVIRLWRTTEDNRSQLFYAFQCNLSGPAEEVAAQTASLEQPPPRRQETANAQEHGPGWRRLERAAR